MQTLPLEQFGSPNRKGLQTFLEYCQQTAVAENHAIIASITLPSEYLDPLAVLQSVNDPSSEHCYIERNSKHEGVACAEPVLRFATSGKNRFHEARTFVECWSKYSIFVGDAALPWAGPHFFCSAAFEEDAGGENAFIEESLQLFLPRWQVGWKGPRFSATANIVVDRDTPISLLIEPIWRAHQRFTSFEFDPEELANREMPDASTCRILNQRVSEEGYLEAVRSALQLIQQDQLQKVVVSRQLDIETSGHFIPLDLLNKLRKKYPDCCSFSYQNGRGESFIGSTPERLVRVQNGVFETEALAGSIERGESARQDAFFSRQLLSSEKDRVEHGLVLQFIHEALRAMGLKAQASQIPEILQLSNIQHLRVPLKGELLHGMHIFDLVDALHPTPALGGYPRDVALKCIAQLEHCQRERYGGLTGWVDHQGNGEFTVNIRCARVQTNHAKLYAGAGIVADSDPEKELKETELKLIGMLPNFMNLD